jgi:hypothetical protein
LFILTFGYLVKFVIFVFRRMEIATQFIIQIYSV